MMEYHKSVMLDEVVGLLAPEPNKVIVDCTLGNGGHSLALLERGAKVIGLDYDPGNLEIAKKRITESGFEKNFVGKEANFRDLPKVLASLGVNKVDGILFDLGLSRNQQVSQDRGFSFNDESSLDMRLNQILQTENAELIVNVASEEELFSIFSKNAQERMARPLAQKIIRERQKEAIKTGKRLAKIVNDFYKQRKIYSRIDPSTKIFMALRIAINSEFSNLKEALSQVRNLVVKGGKVVVISFHSGEDRIVKMGLKGNKRILPSREEILTNPLSRSAVMRWVRID